jgi:hypothetical protein
MNQRRLGISVAVLALASSMATHAQPAQGMIGYWNFDEGSGTVAHDTSGNAYNGTVTGAVWTTGKINSALSFNGSTNAVITPNIALGNAYSISAWVNPGVTTQGAYVRIAETQYNAGLYLGTNSSGTKYKFIVNNASGATGSCGAAYGCAEGGTITGGWHLVTATYDGTTARLFVDTSQVGLETFNATATDLPLYIGRYYATNAGGWNGSIDEVRLYNRALTAAEVSNIYNYVGGPPDTTAPSIPATVSGRGLRHADQCVLAGKYRQCRGDRISGVSERHPGGDRHKTFLFRYWSDALHDLLVHGRCL